MNARTEVPRCPWCRSTALIVRGQMPEFTRYRCRRCMAEFDHNTGSSDD